MLITLRSMATGSVSKWAKLRAAADSFFHEKGIESEETFGRSRWHRFAHLCLLVVKSFQRNRCPVRAASLAYTTLLALVPLLAVAVSITTSMLQWQEWHPVEDGLCLLHLGPGCESDGSHKNDRAQRDDRPIVNDAFNE